MNFKKFKDKNIAFEESLEDEWSKGLEIVETPLGSRTPLYLGIFIFFVGLVLASRIFYLNFYQGKVYSLRAEANASQSEIIPAPRGLILDRNGKILVKNTPVFTAKLDAKEFLNNNSSQEETLSAIESILQIPRDMVWSLIRDQSAQEFSGPIILSEDLGQSELVQLKGLNLPAIVIGNSFLREYTDGQVFAPVLGYVGRVDAEDLKNNPGLNGDEFIGKAGIEAFYDASLQGKNGVILRRRNSRGDILNKEETSEPKIGSTIRLTLDTDFENYFYYRLAAGLRTLGRNVGVGLAVNPQNGEVLALVSLPSYDNNLLSGSGHNQEKFDILNSEDRPLFNRVTSGFYNPGSTIKPLVGLAALKEGVIDAKREIFSPGYLDIPNPYNPDTPTRYLDWRYQGNVNLAAAIAQSSNVYFYTVGGGAGDIKGLGINRLIDWWKKFNLGRPTGIDLPEETDGFLPSVEWKEKKSHRPWLLGDTYNVSIGQGDLLLTPLQLLNYISAIANGGKILKPVLNLDAPHPQVMADISYLLPQMKEVEKGMLATVQAELGTAHLLADLGFSVAAKTGSAQVKNNAQENAIFVGYAPVSAEVAAGKPAANPQIAVLILIENSREGSLNAVPIAKDVLNWYYWNRINK